MSKLLFTPSSFQIDSFHDRDWVEAAGFELVWNPYGRRLTEAEVSNLLDEHVVGMVAGVEPLTASVLQKAKSLRVISRCGIGLDNVDLEAAAQYGIRVFNTPNAPTVAVAELTLAHILALSRHVALSNRDIHAGQWQPLMGRLIAKQTVGIVGFGRIGRYVAKLLGAFGARLLVYEKNPTPCCESVTFVDFETLLQESDIITLHIPYDQSTHHLINDAALDMMKPSALLINVARGGLIDEAALYTAMKAQRLAGVALDCFEEEPYKGALCSCDHVQMTAHMGSYAREARSIMESEACSLLVSALQTLGLITEGTVKQ